MDFNWSTFFLEIINFLVLVWLVKRFFYKPVQNIISSRQVKIDEQIANAKALQSEAETMQAQYENRLTEWESEKQQQQNQLNQELDEQKKQQLALVEKLIEEEKQKNASQQEKQGQIQQRKSERQALDQGARFTATLLKELTSQELENKVIELFLKNLSNYSSEQKQKIASLFSDKNPMLEVISAYPLSQIHKDKIRNALQSLVNQPVQCNYKTDSTIIAGLRINLGAYVFRANLADELKYFSDSSNGIE